MAHQHQHHHRQQQQQQHRASRNYGASNMKQQQQHHHHPTSSEEDEDDSISQAGGCDRIRRNTYLNVQPTRQESSGGGGGRTDTGHAHPSHETIEVRLNENYFAKERQVLVDLLANCRQKLSNMQMFNPAKNQSIKEQQQQSWNENEKYTLDSLNEIKGPLDEQFQWTRPEDGREVWPSKLQYFLAITSYSIGLGNVIRFPILVQKNGGLAFIIPFVIMLVLEGIPLFYLELAIGQRMRKAAISCWNLVSPFAAGIGIASAAVSFIIGLYYNTLVAWTLLYLYAATKGEPLPFAVCPAAAATAASSGSQPPNPAAPAAAASMPTTGNNSNETECQITGPFEYYWYRQTLNSSGDVNEWTNFNWPVTLALMLAWLISYLCLFKGLSSSKRIVYITFTFPYVILTVFFFKAFQLKGMTDGIYYLFEPDWYKLVDPYVWLQAAAQVFFSLGLGFGGLIALSSYNPVNNNCYRDAVKVSLINFFTSIYAGVVIFSILGYKANLSHDKCLMEREQAIEFYLSDYNLKVIDYGAVFNQIIEDHQQQQQQQATGEQLIQNSTLPLANNSSPPMLTAADLEGSENDYFDTSDALASIRSLDRQLDSAADAAAAGAAAASSAGFDYGDSDTEFIIDASSMINKSDLDKIIDQIPGLVQCSIKRELAHASQGNGLVFVVMAEALSTFQSAPLWASIFFLMLLTLGLDSQFGNLEGLLSSIADLNCCASSIKRQAVTAIICLLSLVISIGMFAHGAGSYMFAIFDEYAGSFSLVLIALFELIAVSYLYGLKRFCDDCELMTGKRPPFIIMLSWRYLSPILLLVVIFATIREFAVSLTYDVWSVVATEAVASNGSDQAAAAAAGGRHLVTKLWPDWCILLGACLILACVVWIPAIAVLKILRIQLIREENLNQCWFPAEELREFHDIQEEHRVTQLERVLFGFSSEDD